MIISEKHLYGQNPLGITNNIRFYISLKLEFWLVILGILYEHSLGSTHSGTL